MIKKTRAQILVKAIEATAVEYPNSVVGDLLMLFPQDVVMKLLVTFAGEQVTFPKLDTIWRSYRNKVIYDTLKIKNTRDTRSQLGITFGISDDKVSRVFSYEKTKRTNISPTTLERSAKRAYQSNLEDLMKDVKVCLTKPDVTTKKC